MRREDDCIEMRRWATRGGDNMSISETDNIFFFSTDLVSGKYKTILEGEF